MIFFSDWRLWRFCIIQFKNSPLNLKRHYHCCPYFYTLYSWPGKSFVKQIYFRDVNIIVPWHWFDVFSTDIRVSDSSTKPISWRSQLTRNLGAFSVAIIRSLSLLQIMQNKKFKSIRSADVLFIDSTSYKGIPLSDISMDRFT